MPPKEPECMNPSSDDEHDNINVGDKAVLSSKITDPEYHIDCWQQDHTGAMSCHVMSCPWMCIRSDSPRHTHRS